jgi:hypothetical protein
MPSPSSFVGGWAQASKGPIEATLARQGLRPSLAAEIHRVNAEQREAGHDSRGFIEISAERSGQETRHQRPEARDDAGRTVAERHRGRSNVGREQLGDVDGVARKHAQHKEPVNDQQVW